MNDNKNRPRSSNARLQDRIILYLGSQHGVETVTKLSRVLESPRSSTSRAINRLKAEGLTEKVGGRWILTDEGDAEEAKLRQRLPERSRRAHKEIARIARLQKEVERTIGSSTMRQVSLALQTMPKIPSGLESLSKKVQIQAVLPKTTSMIPTISNAMPDMSAVQTAMKSIGSSSQINYQVKPFVETLRLVDSVGVGNPVISSSLRAISESVQVNHAAYMRSISQAAIASSVTPAKFAALFGTLDFLNKKLGEGMFASVQVRAVEDLLKRIPSLTINANTFQSLVPSIDLASGLAVRKILEQADFESFLEGYVVSDDPGNVTLDPSNDVPLDFLPKNWDELPEAMKLRFIAVMTFIILHVTLLATQNQPNDSEYVKDLVHSLTGTAATVAICKELELFKDE